MATKPRTTPAPAAAAAEAATAPAAPAFTFGDAAVPTTTRTVTVVNPLLAVCKTVAETMTGDAERSTIAKTVNAADAQQVAKIKRWLALAGQEIGVTFRSIVGEDNVVTFWAVKRIEHKNRKNGTKNAAK